ncbi:MAG: UDP-N-acetylmuramate dehydrogenase [bacterium]
MQNIQNIPLSKLTTYQIGGYCLGVICTRSQEEYISTLLELSTKAPYRIIGKGSNLLISDEKLDFFVVTGKYRDVKIYKEDGKFIVFVTPFTELQFFIKTLIWKGISGYEELAAIPATVGGAVFNNAGTKNVEISKYLRKVTVYKRKTGEIVNMYVDSSFFCYRNSLFKEETLNGNPMDIIELVFEFPLHNLINPESLYRKYKEVWEKRQQTQPLSFKSCGSVFKNLPNLAAWQIIDSLGYRGFRIGQAKVSEKHCNFIINLGNAKFSHVYEIIQRIKNHSRNQNILLEEEVEIWK